MYTFLKQRRQSFAQARDPGRSASLRRSRCFSYRISIGAYDLRLLQYFFHGLRQKRVAGLDGERYGTSAKQCRVSMHGVNGEGGNWSGQTWLTVYSGNTAESKIVVEKPVEGSALGESQIVLVTIVRTLTFLVEEHSKCESRANSQELETVGSSSGLMGRVDKAQFQTFTFGRVQHRECKTRPSSQDFTGEKKVSKQLSAGRTSGLAAVYLTPFPFFIPCSE